MTTAIDKSFWLRSAALSVTPKAGGTGKRFTDLHIAFDVSKHLSGEPNTANIRIWNLSEGSRKGIREKESVVTLEAGYNGERSVLYRGEVTRAEHAHDGPDWISSIECASDLAVLRDTRIALTFRGGTSKSSVVRRIASKLGGVALGTVNSDALRGVLPAARSVVGSARRILDSLADDWGFRWSINDGTLTVVDLGSKRGSRVAIRLSPGTGLIGSPRWTEDGLEVRALLLPELQPGGVVQVDAAATKGLFQATAISSMGDTHGETWETTATCKEAK
jgi:hypothetical protein